MIYRPEWYKNQGYKTKDNPLKSNEAQEAENQNQKDENSGKPEGATLVVAKNRNGQQGKFTLMFTPKHQRFDNAMEGYDAESGSSYRGGGSSSSNGIDISED
jgi:replicative DNA helicase